MKREVFFTPEAKADLLDLYDYIVVRDGEGRADGCLNRIETACMSLEMLAERGRCRDDVRPGVRVLALERRALIAYKVDAAAVVILRILYGGRNVELAFSELPDAN